MARKPKPRNAKHGTYAEDGSRWLGLADGVRCARVDAIDFHWLNQWSWGAGCGGRYAMRAAVHGETRMHRLLLRADPDTHVDHINGDTFDNRRENLRRATLSQNQGNAKVRVDSPTGFKGVWRHGEGWRARLRTNGKCYYGTLRRDVIAAACDYNVLALRHFGEYAKLNRMD